MERGSTFFLSILRVPFRPSYYVLIWRGGGPRHLLTSRLRVCSCNMGMPKQEIGQPFSFVKTYLIQNEKVDKYSWREGRKPKRRVCWALLKVTERSLASSILGSRGWGLFCIFQCMRGRVPLITLVRRYEDIPPCSGLYQYIRLVQRRVSRRRPS